jgi:hypothetical protein
VAAIANEFLQQEHGAERQEGEVLEFISLTLKLRFLLQWSQELVYFLSAFAFYFKTNVKTLSVEK